MKKEELEINNFSRVKLMAYKEDTVYRTNNNDVVIIGGANIDIQGISSSSIIMNDSNPGELNISLGGVARNIAENISKLNLNVSLISAIGSDINGNCILDNATKNNINTEDCLVLENERTSTYLYILNEKGEMVVAINDMKIADNLTKDFLSTKLEKIDKAEFIVLDTNLNKESIHYIANNINNSKLILDTVSATKALRVKGVLHKFFAVKINKNEAEAILSCKISSNREIKEAGDKFIEMGIKHAFITLGESGVYYASENESFFRESIKVNPKNVTGAGDAFTASLVYCLVNKFEPRLLVDFCIAASTIALLSEDTISNEFSIKSINELINKKCKENK